MAAPEYQCEECREKFERGTRLIAETIEHCPDPNFITLPDGQRCHRDSPMAREAWLRRQLEGLGKEGG